MTRLRLMIAFLFLACFSFGQIEKQANAILLKRDFKEFRKFAAGYALEKNSTRISSGIIRDLANGFQESVFYISKSYPLNKGVSITCNPRINIITQGNLIIYFYLESKEMKGFPETFDITSDTTYNFRDTQKITTLKSKFRQTFLVPLNEKELFIDTIYYGKKCGHNGLPTNEQEKIDTWVKNNDTLNLYQWLQSTNTEKQIYAVQGFNSLLLKGVKPNGDAKQLIGYIIRKRGVINTCITCDAKQNEIANVVNTFHF